MGGWQDGSVVRVCPQHVSSWVQPKLPGLLLPSATAECGPGGSWPPQAQTLTPAEPAGMTPLK